MKKHLLPSALLVLFYLPSLAATWNIQVSNFQFSPSTVNATVGDVIHFQWVSGFHTTTSTAVPSGASTWDAPMTSSDQTYDYVVSVAGTYNYFCAVHPSMIGTINVSGSLPVKFGALLVKENSPGNVLLSWQSFEELNIAKYVIKRSIDGVNFLPVGTVKALGTSGSSNTYSFADKTLTKSHSYYYYYVEAISKDGDATLSAIKLHKAMAGRGGILVSIHPNPITSAGHLMLQFNASEQGTLYVSLIDMTGKTINQTQMMAAAGVNSGHWHVNNVKPGKYTLRLQLKDLFETKDIVVVQ